MKNNKLLKYFKTQEQFDTQSIYVEQGSTEDTYIDQNGVEIYGDPDIYPEHICFIEDTKTIFTHNTKYICSLNDSGSCDCKETTILDILKFYNKTTKTFDESYINDNGDEILLSDENGYLLATDILQEMINNEIIFANTVNKQNISINNLNDKITQIEEQINNIDGANLLVNVTYNELSNLVNINGLLPGQKYRITDYETVTIQSSTMSAGHNFDIIVTALTENTLSENASAIQHENDTYFINNDLSSWKLKYKLENDDINYFWVDSVNGKGIIYEMTDEFNNTLPYDFKNIMFKRYPATVGNNGVIGKYCVFEGLTIEGINYDTTEYKYFYTFSCYDNNGIYDSSLNIYSNNENKLIVTKNHYLPAKLQLVADKGIQYFLNDIAHICDMNLEDGERCEGINNTKIGFNCYNCTILDNSDTWEIKDNTKNVIISQGCNNWEINYNSSNIVIGINNKNWTIGRNNNNVNTGIACSNWTTEDNCNNYIVNNSCSNWLCERNSSYWNIYNESTSNFRIISNTSGTAENPLVISLSTSPAQQLVGFNEYNILTIWNNASPINYPIIERTDTGPSEADCIYLAPNVYNVWINNKLPQYVKLSLPKTDMVGEYILRFTIPLNVTNYSLIILNEITWINNTPPNWESNRTYEISIINGLATFIVF